MPTEPLEHFVLVDFENVPNVDLALVAALPVQVALLIGKNQKTMDYDLTSQIHQQAAQVRLVKVNATGRNALDIILACYLGQAVQRHPGAQFYIVSKDKDYDPLISHLLSKEVKVARATSFDSLPFLPRPKRAAAATVKPAVDRRAKLIARLKNPSNQARPSSGKALLAHIKTALGNEATETKVADILHELIKEHALTIDPKDRVDYAS
ncbi:MAG: PIN domain-containing protein [Opitutaceae bacterium]